MNTKVAAWDLVGGLFWERGRPDSRPNTTEVEMFLDDLAPGVRCAIIGASTKDLIRAALQRRLDVTVLDFSRRMSAALIDNLGFEVTVESQDITAPIAGHLLKNFDVVLSDRLINRMTAEEAPRALSGMLALLTDRGIVRTSIKLGLYPMDKVMIEEGKCRGSLQAFYDETTMTIDYSAAGPVLEKCLLPHGNIDREMLLEWYFHRGRERRFRESDVIELVELAKDGNRSFKHRDTMSFPNPHGISLFSFEALGS